MFWKVHQNYLTFNAIQWPNGKMHTITQWLNDFCKYSFGFNLMDVLFPNWRWSDPIWSHTSFSIRLAIRITMVHVLTVRPRMREPLETLLALKRLFDKEKQLDLHNSIQTWPRVLEPRGHDSLWQIFPRWGGGKLFSWPNAKTFYGLNSTKLTSI